MAEHGSTGGITANRMFDGQPSRWKEFYTYVMYCDIPKLFKEIEPILTSAAPLPNDEAKKQAAAFHIHLLERLRGDALLKVACKSDDGRVVWKKLLGFYHKSEDEENAMIVQKVSQPNIVLTECNGDYQQFFEAMVHLNTISDERKMNLTTTIMLNITNLLPESFYPVVKQKVTNKDMSFTDYMSELKAWAIFLKGKTDSGIVATKKEDIDKKVDVKPKEEEAMHMFYKKKKRFTGEKTYVNKSRLGFKTRDGQWKEVRTKDGPLCFNCEQYGHTKDYCPNPKHEAHYVDASAIAVTREGLLNWVCDSGAKCHYTPFLSDFITIDMNTKGHVNVANSAEIAIEGYGKVSIKVQTLDGVETTMIFNAYYVPDLCKILFSSVKARNDGVTTIIARKGEIPYLELENGKKIILNESEGMLLIKESMNTAYCVQSTEDPLLDHWRRAHARMMKGILCEACTLGKLRAFPHSRHIKTKAAKVGDLEHTDLAGPLPASRSGYQHVQCFVDSNSRWTEVSLLKNKSDALAATDLHLKHAKAEGFPVRVLFSDRGGELVSADFKKMLIENGTLQSTTAPYTPQDNGLAERRWRSIFEMVRCMMFHSQVDKHLWPYAVKQAVLILNRLNLEVLGGKSPYEVKYGGKPDMSILRVFGCPAYVHDELVHGKLEPRALKGIHLGYDEESNSHIILIGNNIRRSRSVVFDEYFTHADLSETNLNDTTCVPNISQNETVFPRIENGAPLVERLSYHEDSQLEMPPLEAAESPNSQEVAPSNAEDEGEDVSDPAEVKHSEVSQQQAEVLPQPVEEGQPLRRSHRLLEKPHPFISASTVHDKATKASASANKKKRGAHHVFTVKDHSVNQLVPKSYEEATSNEMKTLWMPAIEAEMNSLMKYGVLEPANSPTDGKCVDAKWIFTLKEDGRRKARLVGRGFTQEFGVDYFETFAPVGRITSLRILFAVATQKGWNVEYSDITTAFLNGDLEEEVYLTPPPGFTIAPGRVFRLRKALYGLKQSPRIWNHTLNVFLGELELVQSDVDECMWTWTNNGHELLLYTYVDDLVYTSSSQVLIDEFKQKLENRFALKHGGTVKCALGMEVHQRDGILKLTQTAKIDKLLLDYGMENCNGVSSPMLKMDTSNDTPLEDPKVYQSLVGRLIYIMNCTRPDLAFVVGFLARSMTKPTDRSFALAKHVLRYLKTTKDYGIEFEKQSTFSMFGHTDSDWSAGLSTSGYVFMLNGPISWASKKQKSAALSSAEAELIAATSAAQEAVYLKNLLNTLNVKCSTVPLFIDSSSAKSLIEEPRYSPAMKHIVIRRLFVSEAVQSGKVKMIRVDTKNNLADIMTKMMSGKTFVNAAAKLIQGD